MRRPLEGVRIVDFCWVGAGSYTTKLLADAGADVIKIESAAKVDGLRLSPPFPGGTAGVNRSGYFADRNTDKRSLTLNMKLPEAQKLARRLIATSDVVTNNFTPGTMAKFGLSWEEVHTFAPHAVYLAMSMQGATGPERDSLGYGHTISALTGVQYLTGIPGRTPCGTGTNFPDHIPNPAHAAFAVLAALRHQRRTGEGQYIDLAQTEATVALLGPYVAQASLSSELILAEGNSHPRHSPHGAYRTAGEDNWLALAVTADEQWVALVDVLMLTDERCAGAWADVQARLEDREEVDAVVADAVGASDVGELVERLTAVGIPCGKVQDASDVVARDPQLTHRGHWIYLDHTEMGRTIYNREPYRFSKSEVRPTRPAPLLGQDTDVILREELGLSSEAIRALRESGVVR